MLAHLSRFHAAIRCRPSWLETLICNAGFRVPRAAEAVTCATAGTAVTCATECATECGTECATASMAGPARCRPVRSVSTIQRIDSLSCSESNMGDANAR